MRTHNSFLPVIEGVDYLFMVNCVSDNLVDLLHLYSPEMKIAQRVYQANLKGKD